MIQTIYIRQGQTALVVAVSKGKLGAVDVLLRVLGGDLDRDLDKGSKVAV